ncbi:hypothetical protein [Deinococcus radiopugnans]|uniref:Uncharacterized protein n=2 Tax=Deinococcus radiopugnans TaxID=57497 RepID=A0ABR6NV14_9DEIO|nr:hypothetical protein [Deinococcus radiopugnans]MBB6017898.1 hypothetical protein [Deinococcus radiopugnans ATCC 19172]
MHRWLFPAVLLLSASAGAQDLQKCGGLSNPPAWVRSGVYAGVLGAKEITLGLNPRQAEGNRYFYAGQANELRLTPFHSGETLILQEEVRKSLGAAPVVTGCFTLVRAEGALRGSWKAPGTSTTLKVSLEPLNVARLPLKLPSSPGLLRLRGRDPLAFVRLNHAWVVSADGQRLREPLSGLDYPRLPQATPALQAALQDRLLSHAVNALACAMDLPENSGGEGYGLSTDVTLLTPRLLSLREDINSYCGGAHPDTATTGLILDRASGRPVPLSALWPSLTAARLKALYLGAATSDPASECDDVLREMQDRFAVSLGSGGLSLTPTSLPHVVSACAESVVIPLGQLRRGANTASRYFADLYPR